MSLNHILDSIVADADNRIAELTSAHKQLTKELRQESDNRLARKSQQIAEQRDQKMRQLKEKTESHARMTRSKALLARRQEFMDRLYTEALNALIALPKDKAETFLKECLKQVHGKGVIEPSKAHEALLKKILPAGCEMGKTINAAGGFHFISDTQEHDFTFEFLIHRLLREATEVKAAQQLFPAHA